MPDWVGARASARVPAFSGKWARCAVVWAHNCSGSTQRRSWSAVCVRALWVVLIGDPRTAQSCASDLCAQYYVRPHVETRVREECVPLCGRKGAQAQRESHTDTSVRVGLRAPSAVWHQSVRRVLCAAARDRRWGPSPQAENHNQSTSRRSVVASPRSVDTYVARSRPKWPESRRICAVFFSQYLTKRTTDTRSCTARRRAVRPRPAAHRCKMVGCSSARQAASNQPHWVLPVR